MAVTPPIRVVIADDHPVFREGLAILLARQDGIAVVGSAGSGEEALELCRAHRPDIALLDLRMGGLDGLATVAALREELPDTRAIVLSGFDADAEVYRAAKVGAAGYLLKHVSPTDLASAIRRVRDGETCFPPALAAKVASMGRQPQLTARQAEVLDLIGMGLANQHIAGRLRIKEGTVKVHVKGILAKLGARDRTHAMAIALDRGLIRRD
jgi:DNA-binding NarL/FixJ family response regulator